MSQNVVIENANWVYTTDNIENHQQIYQPGDQISIVYNKQNTVTQFQKDYLLFRFVPRYDDEDTDPKRLLQPAGDASSLFDVINVQIDGVRLTPGSSLTRQLMNHIRQFLKNSGSDDSLWEALDNDPDHIHINDQNVTKTAGTPNDPLIETVFGNGQNNASAKRQFAQKLMTGGRFYKIKNNQIKGYNSQLTSNQATPPDQDERFSYLILPIHRLLMELNDIKALNMQNVSQLRIDLKLLDTRDCLTIAPPINTDNSDTEYVFKSTDSYVLTNVQLARKKIKLSDLSQPVVRFPIPFTTYSHQSKRITSSSSESIDMTVQGQLQGVICVFTPDASVKNGKVMPASGIDYSSDTMLDSPMNRKFQDLYYIQLENLQVMANDQLFKMNMPLGASREFSTFVTNKIHIEEIFGNKKLNIPFYEYVRNSCVYAIPVQIGPNQQSQGSMNIQVDVEFDQSSSAQHDVTLYRMHVFAVHLNSLRFEDNVFRVER